MRILQSSLRFVLLTLHFFFLGSWLGCVLTEALFKRALLGQGREGELLLARLHKRVDLVVEMPAFLAAVITGALMLRGSAPSVLLHTKIGPGLLAVLANLYCVWLLWWRLAQARSGAWAEFERTHHLQHQVGAVVLIGLPGALSIGIYLLARS